MHSLTIKSILGGLAILLAVLACSMGSSATPTITAATDTATPVIPSATATASPIPATATVPAATATASPIPPTLTATIPPLPTVSSPSIQLLDMLDANNGWALTNNKVVRTTDGGSTWYNCTPAGLNGTPANAFFLNTSTAWVAVMGTNPTTGTLYRTIDGGFSWKSAAVPFGGGSLKFVDAMHGWELIGLNAGMSHESVAIFRSGDGGATWSRVFINDPGAPGASDSLPLAGDKNGITALNANRGWVTGSQPSSDFIYVYITQDGGTTWAHQNLTIPSGYSGAMTGASLPVFFGTNDGVLPVLLFANNNGTDFYVSQDGGQTWKVTTPLAQGGFLAVGSASDFFVWDGSAQLNISHNAGASWSTVKPNINIKNNMISMQFVNASTGWALTSDANNHSVLYKTTNGGVTWNVLVQ
ncbi:MAG: hypothetical protein WCE68_08720 [Anaerolineales bacterium]